jgi:uncharacterized protein YbbK (DUF523 family)
VTSPPSGSSDSPGSAGRAASTSAPAPGGGRPLIVSSCLLGVACNHVGRSSPSEAVVALGRDRRLVPVCPETAGGLPTPRDAAEIQASGRVVTAGGADVTDAYKRGAAHTVRLARAVGAEGAVLKARSPSCGCHEVYDGSFTRTRVPGEGVTAAALRDAGFRVCSEEDVEAAHAPAAAGDSAADPDFDSDADAGSDFDADADAGSHAG